MTVDAGMEKTIVDRVTSVTRPEQILLFGSVARGAANSDSDVDLLILKTDVSNSRKESILIRKALRGLGVAFDVIVMKASWFENTKDVIGSLAYPVYREGKIIYAS